jgi:hypothetical protein
VNHLSFDLTNAWVNQTPASDVESLITGDNHEKAACFNASNP